MKTVIGLCIVAATAFAGWHYTQNDNELKLSDLALENVEALAQGENDQYSQNIWKVYKTSTGHSCTKGGSKKCL